MGHICYDFALSYFCGFSLQNISEVEEQGELDRRAGVNSMRYDHHEGCDFDSPGWQLHIAIFVRFRLLATASLISIYCILTRAGCL